jgi:hypothetical protein
MKFDVIVTTPTPTKTGFAFAYQTPTKTHRPIQASPRPTLNPQQRSLPITWKLLPLLVTIAHVLISPYTKVEETPTLHAVHDILSHGISHEALFKVSFSTREKYDSHRFADIG